MESLANINRNYLIAGCVSQVFLVLYASLNLVAGSSPGYMLSLPTLTGLTLDQVFDVYDSYERSGAIGIGAVMLFVVFIILLCITLQKTANTFGSEELASVFGFVLVLGLLGSLFGAYYYSGVSNPIFYSPSRTLEPPYLVDLIPHPTNSLVWGIMFLACVGVTMISCGSFFMARSNCFRSRSLAKATGILFISAAVLEFSMLLEVAGTITILVGGIVGLACFLRGISTTQ